MRLEEFVALYEKALAETAESSYCGQRKGLGNRRLPDSTPHAPQPAPPLRSAANPSTRATGSV